MVSSGRIIADELINKSWGEMEDGEQEFFDDWLYTAKGHDLYLLLRYVKSRGRRSSVRDLKAVSGEGAEDA